MASSGATCDKYNVKKLSRLTKDTTEEEMKDLYKNWATTYEKVLHSRLLDRKTVQKKKNQIPRINWQLFTWLWFSGAQPFSYYIVTLFERSRT